MFKMIRHTKTLVSSIITPLKQTVRSVYFPANFVNFLKDLPSMECSKLPNGISVVTEHRNTYNACIGIFFENGSRFEEPDENGISHFFEHLAFKGTGVRNKTVLEDQISCTGAKLKCFTNREFSGFYAECLCEDVNVIFDILSDCVFNNLLSAAEIEIQKHTVYHEMVEHDQNTKHLVNDYLHAAAFQGTSLAQTVMGPSYNLYNFKTATICSFRERTLDPLKIAVSAVGGVKHEQVTQLATCLNNLPAGRCTVPFPYRYTGAEITYRNDTLPIAHVAIAVEGPYYSNKDNLIMTLAATLVGGWDRTQAGGLDAACRVARSGSTSQLCHSYQAFNITYKDTGLWGAQFIAPRLVVDDMLLVIQDEWMRLCTCITEGEVERAKAELTTKLLSNNESLTKTCKAMAKWILYNQYKFTLYDIIEAIEAIKLQDFKDTCSKYLYDKCPAITAIGATECLPEYNRVRAGMYWLRY